MWQQRRRDVFLCVTKVRDEDEAALDRVRRRCLSTQALFVSPYHPIAAGLLWQPVSSGRCEMLPSSCLVQRTPPADARSHFSFVPACLPALRQPSTRMCRASNGQREWSCTSVDGEQEMVREGRVREGMGDGCGVCNRSFSSQ